MHELYLKEALALAAIRRGFCAPNPAVGAVVVKNNQVLATGYHWAAGHPHAEVEALKSLNNQAQDATLYVTLEPCCHFGKTPPCTDLLIRSGIKRVVFGMRDPNPQVTNKSETILNKAGIETIYLALPEITHFYRSYTFWWQTKRPYVTAKIALSLDGKIAGAHGRRVNLTGVVAKEFTHQQRKRSDAILTTAKTIICDDPLLNVRLPNETFKKPVYILDSRLSIPLTAKIFDHAERVVLLHDKASQIEVNKFSAKNVQYVAVDRQDDGLHLLQILHLIGKDGVHDLWLEAGGYCFESFVRAKLLQRALIYVAPKWLGETAQTAFSTHNNIFQTVQQITWQSLGDDSLCELIW